MRFDLTAIDKLSPPGLICLKSITALIASLLDIVEVGLGSSRHISTISRMVGRQSKRLREHTMFNYNLRAKAWVMQCPERIAWARSVIGEAKIQRWITKWNVEYALYVTLKDWNGTWPDGYLDNIPPLPQKRLRTFEKGRFEKDALKQHTRTYNWKPFILAKVNTYIKFETAPETAKAINKMSVIPCNSARAWLQPREPRFLKPVEFTPRELVAEAATRLDTQVIEASPKPEDSYLQSIPIKKGAGLKYTQEKPTLKPP